jgi:5-methylcytosine-specific restriction endonuclease McrA
LVSFSLDELKNHLESLWESWMNWDNRGQWKKDIKTWHIDHIKPISLCNSFEEAWQLSNLQPLEAKKNLSKGNRYIG